MKWLEHRDFEFPDLHGEKVMLEETANKVTRSRALPSAAFLGFMLFGASFAQAQEPLSPGETDAAAPSGASMRDIEKSDIRRGHMPDADGDGLGEAAPVARQADLKKLADELVNSQESPTDTDGSGDQNAATKVDAGNALNAGSVSGRAGDPIPGIDITVNQSPGGSSAKSVPAAEGAEESAAAAERKKMKRLEPTYTEPLELMDETDPCPTLPCT